MPAPLSVDTASLRAYGAACTAHAADLDTAAARLAGAAAAAAPMFGPVGARFLASLSRTVQQQAGFLGAVGGRLTEGGTAASGSARAYDVSEDAAAARVIGPW
ncbi:type VII secretion target [Mycobacterium sp. ITM-2016-00317]|uniref:type VII secretion target n=1 Tax=Mycobacterium sp. ITM-2016-00317 TaxID=2099694 RepID=UPI000D42D8BF|nr:type VII secretion target [Mycobacterium sp. ITM-2016-00317]WNG88881.1 type VII secretion target [Mycobacterium sp. ITM-2016-00317]